MSTAKAHFDEDIARARALHTHADSINQQLLRDDVLRASWMMAVGACDAYFSDAYADLIARALQAKEHQPSISIPDRLNNLKVPVTAVISPVTGGWRWRMAARELIEEENVLSLEKIKKLFNHFFRNGHKILSPETVEQWILAPKARMRHFGMSATQYRAAGAHQKHTLKTSALEHFSELFAEIFQRRHDCIHNCDRPKTAPQPIASPAVGKRIDDIEFLVSRCHTAFRDEFPVYLTELGFSAITRNRVCGN